MIFIDVSKWNGIFDWSKAQAQGVEGVYIKATGSGNYGNYEDYKFPLNADTCTLKYKGSYHYFDYQGRSGADQCKYFLDKVGDFGNMRGVLDIEDNFTNGWTNIYGILGTAMREGLAWVNQYRLECGHDPVMYLNLGLAKQKDWLGKYIFRNFLDCPLWIARYGDVPDPLIYSSKERAAWPDYAMWQYTSKGDGYLYGNETGSPYIDLNRVLSLQSLLKPGVVLDPPPVVIPPPLDTLNIQPFSQQDPRWKDIRFGDTTIGANGCLISDIAMMLKYLGLDTDPAKLVAWLKSNGGLYGNLFVWKSVEKLLPGLKFILKYIGSHPDKIDESLSRKMPCLVHVDYDPTTSLIDQHWILIVDKVDGRYVAIDPKDGVRIWFDERYGSSTGNIYNVSTYSFSTTPEPPPIQIPQTSSYEIGKTLVNGQNMRYGPGAANLIIGKINAGIQLPLLAYAKDIYGNPWIRIGHNQWIAQQIRTTKFVERVYVK